MSNSLRMTLRASCHPAATHISCLLPPTFPPRSLSHLPTCCPLDLECASHLLCLQTLPYPSRPYSIVISPLQPSVTVRTFIVIHKSLTQAVYKGKWCFRLSELKVGFTPGIQSLIALCSWCRFPPTCLPSPAGLFHVVTRWPLVFPGSFLTSRVKMFLAQQFQDKAQGLFSLAWIKSHACPWTSHCCQEYYSGPESPGACAPSWEPGDEISPIQTTWSESRGGVVLKGKLGSK